jgi:ABC-type hemin transport system ATPase subunit
MEAMQLQQYDEWLAEHLEELVSQYAGSVVAVHEGKVITVGASEAEVYQQVRKAGLEPPPLVLRVPREQDVQSILRAAPAR